MKEVPFAPAITGPIDDPRTARADSAEITAGLFDEKTRERLERLAESLNFSPLELIREASLRYMDELEEIRPAKLPELSRE
jgi:hypothetical protein